MSLKHESAVGHVTGRGRLHRRMHPPAGFVSLYPVQAPHAHARIVESTSKRHVATRVVAVITAHDIPVKTTPVRSFTMNH